VLFSENKYDDDDDFSTLDISYETRDRIFLQLRFGCFCHDVFCRRAQTSHLSRNEREEDCTKNGVLVPSSWTTLHSRRRSVPRRRRRS